MNARIREVVSSCRIQRSPAAVADFARFPIQVTADDLERAAWIVALKQAERFPAWAEKVEYWQVDDAPEALALIEREVMDLAARLAAARSK